MATRLSQAQCDRISSLLRQGKPISEIARGYGITHQAVRTIGESGSYSEFDTVPVTRDPTPAEIREHPSHLVEG